MALQAVSAPTTIRPAATPGIIYIPMVHSGFQGDKNYFPELKLSDTTKATIVADIASAQHEDIARIIAIDLANGKCWDASAEIAKEVLDIFMSEREGIPGWCRDFLEDKLGCEHVADAERWEARNWEAA